jgi:hypothetical protein
MGVKYLALIFLLAAASSFDSPQPGTLVDYVDEEAGFSFRYPEYWVLVEDVDTMIEVQDGSIDLIRQEDLKEEERAAYRVMAHVEGSPEYLSNVAVLVYPHSRAYQDSESAVQAVVSDFDERKASGTWFLEETYLGESHTYVYRRRIAVPRWDDEIIITYYLTASRTNAYMLVKTVLTNALTEENVDNFNQLVQSFRVTANESGAVDPSLDWGSFKPGEDVEGGGAEGEVGRVVVREDFQGNTRGWPVGDDSKIRDGSYVLDSREGYPFTVTNTGLGQIAFDFSYEGEATFLEGDDSAGYGLVFGYRDEDNYFAFLVTAGGQFLVIEERNGRVENHIPWTSTGLLSGETHSLMVQGDYQTVSDEGLTHRYELIFYIDKQAVGKVRLDRILDVSGWYGVFVSSELNVGFDWLESRNYVLDAVMSLERFE